MSSYRIAELRNIPAGSCHLRIVHGSARHPQHQVEDLIITHTHGRANARGMIPVVLGGRPSVLRASTRVEVLTDVILTPREKLIAAGKLLPKEEPGEKPVW